MAETTPPLPPMPPKHFTPTRCPINTLDCYNPGWRCRGCGTHWCYRRRTALLCLDCAKRVYPAEEKPQPKEGH